MSYQVSEMIYAVKWGLNHQYFNTVFQRSLFPLTASLSPAFHAECCPSEGDVLDVWRHSDYISHHWEKWGIARRKTGEQQKISATWHLMSLGLKQNVHKWGKWRRNGCRDTSVRFTIVLPWVPFSWSLTLLFLIFPHL